MKIKEKGKKYYRATAAENKSPGYKLDNIWLSQAVEGKVGGSVEREQIKYHCGKGAIGLFAIKYHISLLWNLITIITTYTDFFS